MSPKPPFYHEKYKKYTAPNFYHMLYQTRMESSVLTFTHNSNTTDLSLETYMTFFTAWYLIKKMSLSATSRDTQNGRYLSLNTGLP